MKFLVLAILSLSSFGMSAKSSELVARYSIKLNAENSITFRGEVTLESVAKAEAALLRLIAKRGEQDYSIYISLDTPGGDVDAGIDFIRFLAQYKNVHTITLFAASMGSAIVEGNPGKRYIVDQGILMFHRAKGGFQGQFEDGEVESRLLMAKNIIRGMERVNSSRMGMSLNEYKQLIKDELWLVDTAAVKMGGVDAIAEVTCSQELSESKDVERIMVMGIIPVEISFSNCPLLRAGEGRVVKDARLMQKYKKEISAKFTRIKEFTPSK